MHSRDNLRLHFLHILLVLATLPDAQVDYLSRYWKSLMDRHVCQTLRSWRRRQRDMRLNLAIGWLCDKYGRGGADAYYREANLMIKVILD
jgi:hypothetical protein